MTPRRVRALTAYRRETQQNAIALVDHVVQVTPARTAGMNSRRCSIGAWRGRWRRLLAGGEVPVLDYRLIEDDVGVSSTVVVVRIGVRMRICISCTTV
jgi:hypothetical protein